MVAVMSSIRHVLWFGLLLAGSYLRTALYKIKIGGVLKKEKSHPAGGLLLLLKVVWTDWPS